MFPGLNPKKMQAVMKQMGISQEDIDASKVIIETPDKNIIINNPSVTKINMQGQETFQIAGESRQETKESFSEQDIQTVMEKTNKSKQEVTDFLGKNNGDIAVAITELKK